jgi:hypothetical protein
MSPCSFAHQWRAGTNSDSISGNQSPCCQRENAPQPDVSAEPTAPVVQVLQTRFLRAWQKMLDEGVDYFQVQGDLAHAQTPTKD